MSQERDFVHYIKENDIKKVKELIKQGVDINHGFGMQGPPLCAAISANRLEIVRCLLEAKCNPNIQDYDGESPLCLALRKDYIDIVELLIKAGCRVNKEDPVTTKTPLVIATEKQLPKVVTWLIQSECDVNKCDNSRKTALFTAVSVNNSEIMELLLDAGCRVNTCNKIDGENPLHLASKLGYENAVKGLLSTIKADYAGSSKKSKENEISDILNKCEGALSRGEEPQADLILRLKLEDPHRVCDVNCSTSFGSSALHLACEHNHFNIAEILLKANCDPSPKDPNNKTPLHFAVKNDNANMIDLLLNYGADPNVVAWDSSSFHVYTKAQKVSPLHLAAMKGNLKVVKKLVEGGADIEVKNHKGEPPIFKTLYAGQADVAEYLLNIAIEQSLDISKWEDHFANTLLHAAIWIPESPGKVINLLVNCGCVVNKTNNQKKSPLHIAAEFNLVEAAKALLDNGCPLKSRDSSGETPMHVSALNDNKEIMRLFIAYGVDVNALCMPDNKDDEFDVRDLSLLTVCPMENFDFSNQIPSNSSLLMTALEQEHYDFAKLLLESGLDVTAKHIRFTCLRLQSTQENEETDSEFISDTEFYEDLQERTSTPMSLASYCRNTIRSYFWENDIFFTKIEALPIPKKLKQYLRVFEI